MSLTKEVLEQLLQQTIYIKDVFNNNWYDLIEETRYQDFITVHNIRIRKWIITNNIRQQKCKSLWYYCSEIQELNDIIEHLLTHISYQPGGLGMIEAKDHFEKSI